MHRGKAKLRQDLRGLQSTVSFACIFFKKLVNYVCVSVHMPQCICGGQRVTCGSQFSPSALWVMRTELRSSSLAASAFTCRAPPLAFFAF